MLVATGLPRRDRSIWKSYSTRISDAGKSRIRLALSERYRQYKILFANFLLGEENPTVRTLEGLLRILSYVGHLVRSHGEKWSKTVMPIFLNFKIFDRFQSKLWKINFDWKLVAKNWKWKDWFCWIDQFLTNFSVFLRIFNTFLYVGATCFFFVSIITSLPRYFWFLFFAKAYAYLKKIDLINYQTIDSKIHVFGHHSKWKLINRKKIWSFIKMRPMLTHFLPNSEAFIMVFVASCNKTPQIKSLFYQYVERLHFYKFFIN